MISSSAYALYNTSTNEVGVDADLVRAFTPIDAPSREALEYPFSFIDTLFEVDNMTYGILDEESCSAGNFPNNITEYYYVREGWNDGDAWECMCKLDNDCYVFYSANCDYTGFDCQGGMNLIISKSQKSLFYTGITDAQRYRILSSNVVTESDRDEDEY